VTSRLGTGKSLTFFLQCMTSFQKKTNTNNLIFLLDVSTDSEVLQSLFWAKSYWRRIAKQEEKRKLLYYIIVTVQFSRACGADGRGRIYECVFLLHTKHG
jgi:hypothetical protein